MQDRRIKTILTAQPVLEGAGVHLKRAFGYYEIPQFDPFLLFDDFRNDKPELYLKGFPWHPHRGIETITYMLEGSAEHGDSMGNSGVIRGGDVQWMTAGSGIIHQEMPKPDEKGRMYGFQLWSNLPSTHKMMAPRYQDIKKEDIPTAEETGGVKLKIICGSYGNTTGPVKDIITNPQYFDIFVPANSEFVLKTRQEDNCFIYVFEGEATIDNKILANTQIALFESGDSITIKTNDYSFRCLFISGKPLNEPIAWGGPIVMNTDAELKTAFAEYHNGTFIKDKK